GLEPRARTAGRVRGRSRHRRARSARRRRGPGPQRAGAPHLALPARPAHRRLRRPAQAVPRLNTPDGAAPGGLHDQPHAIVEREGVRYTLLGTAHVSQASVDAVNAELASGRYDTIAVELDA